MKAEELKQIEQGNIGWEELFVAKYFGIKDRNMEEMLKSYHQSKLQVLKKEVEELGALDIKVKIENKEGERIEERPFIEKKEVLNLITNLEDK